MNLLKALEKATIEYEDHFATLIRQKLVGEDER